MGTLKELRPQIFENPEAHAAYEAEKTVLAEEKAEWEREKRRREQQKNEPSVAVRT